MTARADRGVDTRRSELRQLLGDAEWRLDLMMERATLLAAAIAAREVAAEFGIRVDAEIVDDGEAASLVITPKETGS